MQARKKNIAGRIRDAVQPLIEQAGYNIWDVTFYKEASEPILEVSIDKEGGISTDDCSVVTKLVDPILDEMDPIEESYCLMVSGAGSERDLRLPEHEAFAREHGFPVTIRTFTAVDGQKQFEGKLDASDEKTVTLVQQEQKRVFDRKQIAKISCFCEQTPNV